MGRPAVLKVDILADAKGVAKGVGEAESRLGRLSGAAGKVGLGVAAGLAGAGIAAGAFAVASVRAASDVEQSFGAVESVFGTAAAQVKGYAATAATQLGLAKGEYASLAAVVGSQLQGMGKSQADASVETDRLIKLGADLSATFGGSVTDAVGAVGSLLRGERDPIEKYGVAISAADVQARLAAKGQDKLTGAALKTAQANATLTLLTEKTKNAHGAFGRESNTLAGQQARLRAQFENVKATVGAGLTPVLTRLLTFASRTLLPGLQRLGQELAGRLGPAFTAVGRFVTGTVLPAFQNLTGNTNGPTKGALAGLAAFASGPLVNAARTVAGFFTNNLVPAFRAAAQFVSANVLPVLTSLASFFATKVVPAVAALAGPALNGLRTALGGLNGAINANRPQLAAIGGALQSVAGFALRLAPVVGSVLGGAFRVVGGAMGAVVVILGAVVRAAQAAANAIKAVASVASKVGGVVGKLNPFSAGVAGMGVPLFGGGPPLTAPSSGLATAALGDGFTFDSFRNLSTPGVTVIDRRTVDARVFIDGALDAPAVARQLERIMRDQAMRLGRETAYA